MTQTISATLPASTVYVSGTVNDVAVTWTNVGGEIWGAVADRAEDEIYVVELTIVSSSGQSTTASFTLYYGLLNLITDRTQYDVDTLQLLLRTPQSEWTSEQLNEFNLARARGAYNYTDLNRVGNAVIYVSRRLDAEGFNLNLSPKINWVESDIPTQSDMEKYLEDIDAIRSSLKVPSSVPETPDDMEGLTYEEANDIERILLAVDALITNMINVYFYSNEISCGEV